jgi:2-oxoisovalerate dehydrogenase E1 component
MLSARIIRSSVHRGLRLASTVPDMPTLRSRAAADIAKLVEVKQANRFLQQLKDGTCASVPSAFLQDLSAAGMSSEELRCAITAGFLTFLVHVESRIASSVGQGFYTIGPCGEELTAALGLLLRDTDAMALHYRHLAAQIARQLRAGRSIDEILLDRARGHVVSALDPISNGGHCLIGGGPYDFLVTSTLASQSPPAVGRAMGAALGTAFFCFWFYFDHHILSFWVCIFVLASHLKVPSIFKKDMVSFVSLGDGSVNNAHFLAAVNLAEYARYRQFRCPTVFCISDNNFSISLRGYGWLQNEFLNKFRMPVFRANGLDVLDIYAKGKSAIHHARQTSAPSCLVLTGLPRRFGHAATDRQAAYMTEQEIEQVASTNPLEALCSLAVSSGVSTHTDLVTEFQELWKKTASAFDKAASEPKITRRSEVNERNSVALVPVTNQHKVVSQISNAMKVASNTAPGDVMRKHMTRVFDELLGSTANMVYIGEDVTHGGYYLVSDGLNKKYPNRVRDFPPDETTLIGAGIGFAQSGLLPIVEIPYAKYLDCGADMFFEAGISSWLSNRKQPNGMIIRLQGFDRGVFGGNFHTHNMLHLPPGIDVVCYSNGPDYARGMRYAALQASKGRVIMSVDSTNLLNLRNVNGNDDKWRMPFTESNEVFTFDQIRVHPPVSESPKSAKVAIVTYGNGVVTSLQARSELESAGLDNVTVIDCPLLSAVPQVRVHLFTA